MAISHTSEALKAGLSGMTMSWPLMAIGEPFMQIGREYNTRKRASRRSRGVRFGMPCRSFDRVDVYNYDAIRKAFPGIARFGSR